MTVSKLNPRSTEKRLETLTSQKVVLTEEELVILCYESLMTWDQLVYIKIHFLL